VGSPFVTDESLSKKKIKSAAHFIMPRLYVNQEQALFIRQSLVAALENKYGKRDMAGKNENDWEDVVDEQVLCGNSSLRMVGSHKSEKCRNCAGIGYDGLCKLGGCEKEVPRECFVCKGMGKIDIGRSYSLITILDDQGNVFQRLIDQVHKDLNQEVPGGTLYLISSIRSSNKVPTPGFKPYAGAPRFIDPVTGEDHHESKIKTQLARFQGLGEDKLMGNGPTSKKDKILFRPSSPFEQQQFANLVVLLRDSFHDSFYKSLLIKSIFISPSHGSQMGNPLRGSKGVAFINVHGKGSSRCMNNGNMDHNNATIYFEIDLGTQNVYLKCHCRCEKQRPSGIKCKNFVFSGKHVYCPAEITTMLVSKISHLIPLSHSLPLISGNIRSTLSAPLLNSSSSSFQLNDILRPGKTSSFQVLHSRDVAVAAAATTANSPQKKRGFSQSFPEQHSSSSVPVKRASPPLSELEAAEEEMLSLPSTYSLPPGMNPLGKPLI
jgi:hypothetical protein